MTIPCRSCGFIIIIHGSSAPDGWRGLCSNCYKAEGYE